ncbi:hypothetical protein FMUND_13510 [Fusarium mundagurra]|uniref:Uncharacterized protein n=1 Tax=Fusarium mundagurra TaxID=1567541 RepID=A0A8H6D2V1_9HYPO|nr:hypothetical protein FMUND_13510 [Fusarium mundagurra]
MAKLSAEEHELRSLSAQIQNTLYIMGPSSPLTPLLQNTMVEIQRHQESMVDKSSQATTCEAADDASHIAPSSYDTDIDSDEFSIPLPPDDCEEFGADDVTARETSSSLETDSEPAPTAQESAAINGNSVPTKTRVSAWLNETASASSATWTEKNNRKKRKFDDGNDGDDEEDGNSTSLAKRLNTLLRDAVAVALSS